MGPEPLFVKIHKKGASAAGGIHPLPRGEAPAQSFRAMLEFALIFLLILANGIFALSEIAIVSSRKARLRQMADEGRAGARAALELANEPERFLSTVQVGITLVGILAGAFGGARLSEALTPAVARIPFLAEHAASISFGAVVALITYLSLIVGELVPKRIAMGNPERVAALVSRPMALLSRVAGPLVWLLSASSRAVLAPFTRRGEAEPVVTEEEIRILIEQGAEAGVIREAEQQIVERVFRLGDRKIRSLMTPRTELVWIDRREPAEVALSKVAGASYSYYPVCDGRMDNLVGILSAKVLLSQVLSGAKPDIAAATVQPMLVPETTEAFRVLDLFRQSGKHFAVVVDEYGGVSGVVAMNDFLQALVGDFAREGAHEEAGIVDRADGSWLVEAWTPIGDFKSHVGIRNLAGERRRGFETVGGFVLDRFGHIPRVAEHFDEAGFRFEVVDMDGHRIDKILVQRLEESPAEAEEGAE